MSGSNCSFLTHKQVSPGTGKVVWYSHLCKTFPQFVVIHVVKGFSVVNEAEVGIFLEFPWFFYDPLMLAIWPLVPVHFLNPACSSGSSWFLYGCSLAWGILSITLLAWEMSTIVQLLEHSLAFLFFGIRMKTDLFQSCGHCWITQICWHIGVALSHHQLLGC